MSAGWTVAECRRCGATLDVGAERDDAPLCALCAWEAGEDSEVRLIPDGGEELVWVRGASCGKSRTHYHTDPDCYALGRAAEMTQKPLAVLPDDIQECRRCAGTVASGPGKPSTTLADRLEAMDPGDLDPLLDGKNGETLIGDGGGYDIETERLDELRNPENFEFMESASGEKIHIVGTGLPTSLLVIGGRREGRYSDDDEQALCGLVSEFEPVGDIPDDVTEVLDRVCTSCNRHAWRIRNKGKFEEVPL